jgi:hypothetical protein
MAKDPIQSNQSGIEILNRFIRAEQLRSAPTDEWIETKTRLQVCTNLIRKDSSEIPLQGICLRHQFLTFGKSKSQWNNIWKNIYIQ